MRISSWMLVVAWVALVAGGMDIGFDYLRDHPVAFPWPPLPPLVGAVVCQCLLMDRLMRRFSGEGRVG